MGPAQVRDPVLDVERMHLQRGRVNQEPRADEGVMELVVAQHVADVLAQEALDTLPEFLDPVHVRLGHPPGAVGRIGRAGLNGLIRA